MRKRIKAGNNFLITPFTVELLLLLLILLLLLVYKAQNNEIIMNI